MSKRRFIQAVVARSLPPLEKLPAAIQYGETLWEGLSKFGYGAEKGAHREGKDYFKMLDDRQRAWFVKFWKAFNYKIDRNGASMRWGQLGELSDAEYEHIVFAAGKEAQKQLPAGVVRKMAQGWLYDRRFADYAPAKASGGQTKADRLRVLNAELSHLEMLFKSSRSQALEDQMRQVELKIAEVMRS